ncbi:TM2 domain-containing protein [Vibrio scophthalmi]|uniref:TM2 domain-containing protein n=1 Tax=Vibrio scophthalmi TaxID=45658 RepID=UPI003AAD6399
MSNVNGNGGVAVPQKSVGVTYLLWFFLGWLGAHRFYLGRIGSGVIYLLTFGLFGFGLIYDLFVIPRMVREENILNAASVVSNNQNHNQQVININVADLQKAQNKETHENA